MQGLVNLNLDSADLYPWLNYLGLYEFCFLKLIENRTLTLKDGCEDRVYQAFLKYHL